MHAFLALLGGCLFPDDAWYDHRRAELTDLDGDGANALDDCDDAAPGVHPGADERCDGVDEDCDGDVDEAAVDSATWYPDADGDGHGVLEGAVSDCEPPGDMYAEASGDCDDSNASAFPGSQETPYDGVDQNCDGADLDDLDGDGWPSDTIGGDDCDDADARVNPDQEETWANGVTDNDCDGIIESIQIDFGADSFAGWQEADGLGRRVASLGDLDADGLDDVVIGSEHDSTLGAVSGALYRVDGPARGSLADAAALLPFEAGQSFAAGIDAGVDVTGDGVGDLLVSAFGGASTKGSAWLVDGAAWVDRGSASVDEVAAGEVVASVPGTYGPYSVRFLGDVNGDGVEDVALGEPAWDAGAVGSVGRIAVFPTDGFVGTVDDADVIIEGPWTNAYFSGIDRIGDQDGDGLPELLASGGGGLVGAVVSGTTSGNVLDVAMTLIYGDDGTFLRNVFDVDGDGREDVAAVGQENVVSLLTALGSAPTRALGSPTFTFQWEENSGVYDVLPLGDLDGDGRSDMLIPQAWSDSGMQRLWVLMGEDVQAGGSLDAESVALSGVSVVTAALFGFSMALAGDVDGDGQDDIVLGAPDYSLGAVNAGGATLVPLPE